MGNKKSKKSTAVYDKIENLLMQTYRNTGIDFSENELVNFKLRILDSEKYFYSSFDYFIFFNNFLFREQLAILYDNYNQIVEKANKYTEKPLSILIDFDDESEYIMQGNKLELDSLFTIIFEKLEIPTLIFFDMTNAECSYVEDFFKQVIESVELYKYNRKFDCMYFLFPNLDYFVKNENSLVYLTNKSLKGKINYFSDCIFEIINEFSNAIFLNEEIEKFLNCTYPKNISNRKFETFLSEIKPTFAKNFLTFELNHNLEDLDNINIDNFHKVKLFLNICQANCFVIFFNFTLDMNNLEFFEKTIINNIKYVLKKIVFYFTTSNINESILGIKFNFKIKGENEISELAKLSSRSFNINYYNNYSSNSQRENISAREYKSKRDKDKIINYFYDSDTKNLFEILTFELTSIINKFMDFSQFDSDKRKEDITSEDYSSIIKDIHDYSSNNFNKFGNYNNNHNMKNDKEKNRKENKSNMDINKNNKDNHNTEINKNGTLIYNYHPTDQKGNQRVIVKSPRKDLNYEERKNKKKEEKFTRKLNLEFNEITPVYKDVQEIIQYSSDSNYDRGIPKIIKLDHNLHSEKLFFYWEKPEDNKENKLLKVNQRNKEFNNLRNVISNCFKFNKLNEWNILLTLQNMFLEDYIKKSYKIEKSNINLVDYLQKIH